MFKQAEAEPTPGESTIKRVTPENAKDLAYLRYEIDGPREPKWRYRVKKLLNIPTALEREAAKYAERSDRISFIQYKDNKPVAYLQLSSELLSVSNKNLPDNLICIERIGVLESERGKGIGKVLINEASVFAQQRGASGLWLDYLAENTEASMLYEKTGFRVVGESTDRDGRKRLIAYKPVTQVQ